MSHVSTVAVKVKDLEALKTACQGKGWAFRENVQSYKWYGTFIGQKSDISAEMFDSREEFERVMAMDDHERGKYMTAFSGRCDHAIAVPGCPYEVGVRARQDGTYSLIFDAWSSGGLGTALGGPAAPKLAQAYATEAALNEARVQGFAVDHREVMEDGRVHLRLLVSR